MANKSKAKGTAAETRIVRYLRAAGIECDRQPLKGNNDEGDIWFLGPTDRDQMKRIIEVKAGKQTIQVSRTMKKCWLDQTTIEARNFARTQEHFPLTPPGWLIIAKHGANVADYEVWSMDGIVFYYLDDFVINWGGTPQEFKGGKPIG
mgnify:CR=1 FL=1